MSTLAAQLQPGAIRSLAMQNAGAVHSLGAQAASGSANSRLPLDPNAKARSQAVDFETMFLNSMFSQMFTSMDGDGPFGGGGAVGVWRSFLTDEYAKSFARAGGIGIADHVYRSLLTQQEARPTQSSGPNS